MEQIMNDLTSTKIEFLKSVGAGEIPHRNKTLLEHLIGVSEILKEMNAPEYIQDAGLFHSVYGTTYFHHQTVSDRQVVQDLIGEKAELLAYLFCALGSMPTTVTNNEIKEFVKDKSNYVDLSPDISVDRQREITLIKDKKIKDALMLIDFANSEEQSRAREMTLEDAYNV